jgi:sugar phosphate isomerase/epimerase
MTDYDEQAVLVNYIWDHYSRLMSEAERKANRSIEIALKTQGASEKYKQAMAAKYPSDATATELLSEGTWIFRQRAAQVVIDQHHHEIFINRCAKCDRIVKTPKARLCLWCGHSWFDQPVHDD